MLNPDCLCERGRKSERGQTQKRCEGDGHAKVGRCWWGVGWGGGFERVGNLRKERNGRKEGDVEVAQSKTGR